MAIYRLLREAAFDDGTVALLTKAYEDALRELALTDRTDPLTEIVARKIIDYARMGERDPDRLCELALKSLRD
jgi:hypothetical protein